MLANSKKWRSPSLQSSPPPLLQLSGNFPCIGNRQCRDRLFLRAGARGRRQQLEGWRTLLKVPAGAFDFQRFMRTESDLLRYKAEGLPTCRPPPTHPPS